MPKISVIVPVYRVEPYLDRCVQSVLHQSFSDFELVLVDDGSPDHCPELCDAYARKDRRVHALHRENGGLSAARNTGIDWVMEHSDTDWITFLDSDDWLHRDFLLRMLETAEKEGVSLVACGYVDRAKPEEDRDLGPLKPVIASPEEIYIRHYYSCVTSWLKLIPREMLREIRYPQGKLYEDCFTTHKFFFSVSRMAYLPEKMGYYFFNSESISHSVWTPKRLQQLEAHEGRIVFFKEKGLKKALRKERGVLAAKTYEQARQLAILGKAEYAGYLKNLRKQLRVCLLQCLVRGIPLDEKLYGWPWLMGFCGAKCWTKIQQVRGVLLDRLHPAGEA